MKFWSKDGYPKKRVKAGQMISGDICLQLFLWCKAEGLEQLEQLELVFTIFD